ncbi:LysR family transcriptional regulator [Oceanobacillus sp. Castelsardo]|uniref:LysR family transcriptional regulator n=1 Tax=Oceanobacillus sp. Castelsardo TaxID=1851204 RepID=UPI00083986B4|nr:LysR family transcriptional regulator [Oceanobacillus sp. Castelsardo]
MDDTDWKIIKTLYTNKNVTQTAEKFFISQPSLTKKVKKIEKEFHIKIYERKSRGIVFTREGEYLAQKAREIDLKLNRIKENTATMNEHMKGKLNIGVSNHFAKYHLPSILRNFKTVYPEVEFKIQSGLGKEISQLINTENIHIGFIRGDYDWAGSKYLLFKDPMCLFSSSEIKLSTLSSQPRIDYQTGMVIHSLIETWWNDHYDTPPTVGMMVDSMEACKEMVIKGLGYGILPASMLEGHKNINRVDLFDKHKKPIDTNTWMYYSETLLDTKIVSKFVEFVKKYESESKGAVK